MLCTKSHTYVVKVTKKYVCVVMRCWILSLVRHHVSVQFSQTCPGVIPGVQFAQHWHVWNHSQ